MFLLIYTFIFPLCPYTPLPSFSHLSIHTYSNTVHAIHKSFCCPPSFIHSFPCNLPIHSSFHFAVYTHMPFFCFHSVVHSFILITLSSFHPSMSCTCHFPAFNHSFLSVYFIYVQASNSFIHLSIHPLIECSCNLPIYSFIHSSCCIFLQAFHSFT